MRLNITSYTYISEDIMIDFLFRAMILYILKLRITLNYTLQDLINQALMPTVANANKNSFSIFV